MTPSLPAPAVLMAPPKPGLQAAVHSPKTSTNMAAFEARSVLTALSQLGDSAEQVEG